jgi:hypothetical protein
VLSRRETRQCCSQMVRRLLMELDDYNCWVIAEAAGHRGPHRLQHLLSRAVWAAGRLNDGDGVLIVDETADEESPADCAGASPPVQRHPRRHRIVPGHGHLDLCHQPWARADRPYPVPARSLRC